MYLQMDISDTHENEIKVSWKIQLKYLNTEIKIKN